MSEDGKDEHGCLIGKEIWDAEKNACVAIPAANTSPKPDFKNKTVESIVNESLAKIESLETELKQVRGLNAELTSQLSEANKVLEGQERAQLINEIVPMSRYNLNDLVGKSVAELKSIRATLAAAMPPKVNSVAFGVLGKNAAEDRLRGLTVGDLSVVTAAKRKAS